MSEPIYLPHDAKKPIEVGDIFTCTDRQGTYRLQRIEDCRCSFNGKNLHHNLMACRLDDATLEPLRCGQYYFIGYGYVEQGLMLINTEGVPSCRNSQIRIIRRNRPDPEPEPEPLDEDPDVAALQTYLRSKGKKGKVEAVGADQGAKQGGLFD